MKCSGNSVQELPTAFIYSNQFCLVFCTGLFSEFNESIRAYTYQWFGHPKGSFDEMYIEYAYRTNITHVYTGK